MGENVSEITDAKESSFRNMLPTMGISSTIPGKISVKIAKTTGSNAHLTSQQLGTARGSENSYRSGMLSVTATHVPRVAPYGGHLMLFLRYSVVNRRNCRWQDL